MAFFKYPVRINLGITAYGTGDFQTHKILVDDSYAPYAYLSGAKDVFECIEKLFHEYFDHNLDWDRLKFISAKTIKKHNELPQLFLNYICMTNSFFEPKKGEWNNFIEVYKNENGQFKNYEEIITKVGDVIY